MEIEETINKWFAEAQERLVQVDDDPTIDTYFRSIFGVLSNYCPATILLIKKRRSRLPAMALMRVMSELFIKFLWCVHGTTNHQEVKDRIQRWVKSSGKKKINLLEDLLASKRILGETRKSFKEQIKKAKKEIGNIPSSTKEMPDITGNGGLFDQVSKVFNDNVTALLYGQFLPAVHIDTSVLAQCIKRDGHMLIYKGDVDYSLDDLLNHCLSQAYMFVKILYVFYRWDYNQIEQEYFKLIPHTES